MAFGAFQRILFFRFDLRDAFQTPRIHRKDSKSTSKDRRNGELRTEANKTAIASIVEVFERVPQPLLLFPLPLGSKILARRVPKDLDNLENS